MRGGIVEIADLFFRPRAHRLGRPAEIKMAGFQHLAFGHQTAGAQQDLSLDDRPVEDNGAHADQAFVLYDAGMQDYPVADGDPLADNERPTRRVRCGLVRDMQHRIVLHIGAGAYVYVIDVAADDHTRPDAGFLPQLHLADHRGAWMHPSTRSKLRMNAVKRADSGDHI